MSVSTQQKVLRNLLFFIVSNKDDNNWIKYPFNVVTALELVSGLRMLRDSVDKYFERLVPDSFLEVSETRLPLFCF